MYEETQESAEARMFIEPGQNELDRLGGEETKEGEEEEASTTAEPMMAATAAAPMKVAIAPMPTLAAAAAATAAAPMKVAIAPMPTLAAATAAPPEWKTHPWVLYEDEKACREVSGASCAAVTFDGADFFVPPPQPAHEFKVPELADLAADFSEPSAGADLPLFETQGECDEACGQVCDWCEVGSKEYFAPPATAVLACTDAAWDSAFGSAEGK